MEMTLAIVKPDAVAAGNAGNILARLEKRASPSAAYGWSI